MIWLIVINVLAAVGEPLSYSFRADNQGYLSVPIGMGSDGGRVWGKVSLGTSDDSEIRECQLIVLNDEQRRLWSNYLRSWQNSNVADDDGPAQTILSEDFLIDGSSMISMFHTVFDDTIDFNISSKFPEPQRLYVVILFPSAWNSKFFGTLTIDWERDSATLPYLQYQYRFQDKSVMVMTQLMIVFLVWYTVFFLGFRRSAATRIHLFYLLCFLGSFGYLLSWYQGIVLEGSTGDRTGFWTKWLPSTYQKLFDVLEMLMYLLTSLGWQTLRPQLTANELQLITAGVVTSFLLGLLEIRCGDDSLECSGITSARMIVHMFGYLTVIVAFTYNLAVLREMLQQSSIASYDTGRLYKHYRNFNLFRNVFFAFIIQPTVAVVLRTNIIDWQDDWIFITFFWGSKIVLLGILAVVFRPNPGIPEIVDFAVKERRRVRRESVRQVPTEIPSN